MVQQDIVGNFGRLASPDARDGLHPMSSRLARLPVKAKESGIKIWDMPFPALDQDGDGICVGAGWEGWMLTLPVIRKSSPDDWPTMYDIYNRATEIDEWPGNEHDLTFGTSVRAGAEVMRENGFTSEYVHAQSLRDLCLWVTNISSAVIGIPWMEGMTYRNLWDGDFLTLAGNKVGDHCVLVRGIDWDREALRIRNSWGARWGPWYNGDALISFRDMETLLFKMGGDCIAAAELEPYIPPPTPDEIVLKHEYWYQGVVNDAFQYGERFSFPSGGGPTDLSVGPRVEHSPMIWDAEKGGFVSVKILYKDW